MSNKQRLDHLLVRRGLVETHSQASNWIKLGKVTVDGRAVTKPGYFASEASDIRLATTEQYVSRAGLKLASVAEALNLDFQDAVVLDVGSSTGGFTDYALQHGAQRVIAVDVGTEQLHPSLRQDPRVELHEKTDIRDFTPSVTPTIVVVDVSFISLRDILPPISRLMTHDSTLVAMVKPQFEAGRQQVNKGIIKNDTVRREILRDFEVWAKQYFVICDKADSEVHGARGNRERFYSLRIASR